ncbi:MAG: 6-phosphofructokinase [Acetanaerobacterium sp.]
MSETMKTIGVLTSGGDAPGMNAAVRAVVRTGIQKGMRVMGIMRGYNGLITGEMQEMTLRSVSDIIHRGGTMLYTARCARFREQVGLEEAKQVCIKNGIDGIVVIGGDGSFRGARDLSLLGIPCVGLPGTIDNDIAASDYTIGYDTAMNTAMEMVDRLRDTAQSHDRCSVVEVMGRQAGYIALNTGIACGATSILVPEIEYDLKRDIYDRMMNTQGTGKHHFIVVVAEGVVADGNPSLDELARMIRENTKIETRTTVLGHVQRGGSPTVEDRVNASLMGHYAVDLIAKGVGNRVVVLRDNKIVDIDIYEALQMKKSIDRHAYDVAHQISI